MSSTGLSSAGNAVTTNSHVAEQVEALLRAPELRYDPSSLTLLCHYIDEMASRNTYDPEACLAIFQLYLLYPQCFSADVARKILIKGLMNLPNEDCAMYVGMLPQQTEKKEWKRVQELVNLWELLEKCRFKQIWEYLKEPSMQDVISTPGFAENIRRYICDVINLAYHTLSLSDLSVLLGLPTSSHELEKIIQKSGWTIEEVHCGKEVHRVVRAAGAAAAAMREDAALAAAAAAANPAAAAGSGTSSQNSIAAAGGLGVGAGVGGTMVESANSATALLTRKTVEKYMIPENLRSCMALLMK